MESWRRPIEGLRRFARSWSATVAVSGRSMEPTLEVGDWLLVDPGAYRGRAPALGDIVVAPDPRQRERLLIKRVAGIDSTGDLELAGDSTLLSTDSRTFGLVDPRSLGGRAWARYWPPRRIGRLR